jgi:hypothetical protein
MRLARALVLALLVTGLAACVGSDTQQLPQPFIDIGQDVLPDRAVVGVQRVDSDSDGKLEWLVFYRFDQVGKTGPVAALLYDVAAGAGQIPVVYPYKLRTPAETYLAQTQPEVAMMELLTESAETARKELVLSTDYDLAIFRVNGNAINQPADDPALYQCVGFFRSDGGVFLNAETRQVTVTSRGGYERSQLVTRDYYMPHADGYFVAGTTALVPPTASTIDFPEGIPSAILDTPYPEKIVLAFYKTLGRTDAKPTILDYLTPQSANDLMQGRLRFGSPFRLDQIKRAEVKELSYFSTQDDSQATMVMVKVVFTSVSDQDSAVIEVRWPVIRQENRWKMDFPQ